MNRLRTLWSNVVGSLWFVPGLIVIGAILLGVGMVELSSRVGPEFLARWPRIFGASAEGSRSILSGIASSMITVAGVTFSITVVAVTQASSQYTPRILRNFMRDRANQVVLGIFVGIFAYCIVVLGTIRGSDDYAFVPSLAVFLGVLLAIVGIGVLIFFVHHIASTLQASQITARVTRETIATLERLYPVERAHTEAWTDPIEVLSAVPDDAWQPVAAPATGYVQRVDVADLLHVSAHDDLIVRVERMVGDFVVEGMPIAWSARHPRGGSAAYSRSGEPEFPDLASRYGVGTYRTIDQDVGFGIRQLVDIALKALSPGINDSTTAATCVDYLGAILVRLADRYIEPTFRSDDGVLRIVGPGPSFELFLRAACDEIRQYASGNLNVLAHQVDALATVGRAAKRADRRAMVLDQMTHLRELIDQTVRFDQDRTILLERVDQAIERVPVNERVLV
jgi:uncharacterized membrane protein